MKKILAIALVMALLSIATIGGTLSYFTATDSDSNTMEVGNVQIEQHELDRNGNPFQDQNMYPAVILEATNHVIPKETNGLWKDVAINNEIDKIVTVKNTGSEAAYIRTIFAFETGKIYKENSTEVYGYIHDIYLGVNGTMTFLKDANDQFVTFTLNGTEYALAVCTYDAILAPNDTTPSSLRQFLLSPNAGNEFYDLISGSYEILVLSQAVQSTGFENLGAEYALNEAFGAVTAEKAAEWFANVN